MMNKSTSKTTFLLATMSLGASIGLQGNIISIFEDGIDLGNFNAITNVADAETVVINPSALTGDAIRQFDNASNRTVMRYQPVTVDYSGGFQLSMDVYDTSSSGGNLLRIGPDGASMAGAANASFGVRILADGSIAAEAGGGNITWTNAFTPSTAFNLSIVYNTSGSSLNVPGGGTTLAANEWAIFVDGTALSNGTASTNLLERNVGVSGAQDVWWLTGLLGSATGADIQYDNIIINTGSDIAVVPEPSVTALATGVLFMGLVMFRRFRKNSR